MKQSYITVTDQFCGAGGSSQGVRRIAGRIPGVEVKLAMNHWKLAIETHNTNFPDTIHDCTDISACDPRRYPSTDILITSPECTNHSLAKGTKRLQAQMDLFNSCKLDPSAERSRATMWDVPRFAEYHNYNIIIVENVVDAREWVMYPAWLNAMHLLGYLHKAVYFNSMFFHPTPQSRDRMYVFFWKKGNKAPNMDFMPDAHCPHCNTAVKAIQRWKNPDRQFGKYGKQYTYICPLCMKEVTPFYYAAFNCIDWSDTGSRIGDRKRPLNNNTLRRIEYGLKKFGNQSILIHTNYSKEARCVERTLLDAAFTQTSRTSQAIIHPFILKQEHSQPMNIRPVMESLQTQTTRQSMALVTPFLVEMKKTSNTRGIDKPLSTLTSVTYHGLVTPEAWKSFVTYFYGNAQASGISEPVGTVSTRDRMALVSHQTPRIEDCYFRMLRPDEIKLAMAFDRDYIILGNNKNQVKQCGNAVTPPVMEWLVERGIESLAS